MNHSVDPRFEEIKELAEVCKKGDLERVKTLLRSHPEVLNSPDLDTRFIYPESCIWSPLGIAANNGHETLVRYLLDSGADPVPYEVAGQYHHHTYGNWTDELLQRGYDGIVQAIHNALSQRYGPLLDEANIRQAVVEKNIDRVRELLREQPERARQIDCVANTPLHIAVASDNLAMTELLVENGSPINALNGSGRSPGVVALFGLHRWWRNDEKKEVLDFLLGKGADYTMLLAATRGDAAQVREVLKAAPASANAADPCFRRPLSGAASKGHTEIVRILLEHGADPNAKEAVCQGGLALYSAVAQGFKEIALLLLEHGANPESWMDSSGDAVFAAHHWKHPDLLHLLYSFGATMQLQVYAAAHRIDVIAEVLKAAPSRANEVFPYGWDDNGSEDLAYNIMRLAIRHGARFENASAWNLRWTVVKYPKVFRLLQEHGANPDLPLAGLAGDMRRRYKDAAEQLRTITFLVEDCGANVNCRGDEGLTALALAVRAGHQDIVEYLISKGAAIDPDGPDWTKPLKLAAHHGHADIVKLLRALYARSVE
jgi:ankyrin repeat protein